MRSKRTTLDWLLTSDEVFLLVVLIFALFGVGVVVGQLFFS